MSSVNVMEREMTPLVRSDMYESMKQEIMKELLREMKGEVPEKPVEENVEEGPLTFGMRLKKLREEKGLSRTMCCQLLGVTNSTLSTWESDKQPPNGPNLRRIAHLLEVTLPELLGVTTLDTPKEIQRVSVYTKLTYDEHEKLLEACKRKGVRKGTFVREIITQSLSMEEA